MDGPPYRALIVTVPKIEPNRYYTGQLIDLYTYNFAYLGTRAFGNDGGTFMIAGPGWKRATPAGKGCEPLRDPIRLSYFSHATLQRCRSADCEQDPGWLQGAAAERVLNSLARRCASCQVAEDRRPADGRGCVPVRELPFPVLPAKSVRKSMLLARFAKINVGPGSDFDIS